MSSPGGLIAEAGLSVVSGMRPGSRRHRGAAHLQRALGLPAPARPADLAVWQRVVAILAADTTAAQRSAREVLARRQGPDTDPNDPLGALWSDYPLPALQVLADQDHRFAHAVALGAVAHRPAIRADVAVALAAQVRRADPDHSAWGELADARVAAYLERISDLPSEFSPAHRTAEPKSVHQKTAEAAIFADLARQAAEFPTGPLGGVPALVESELEERLLLIETVVADLRCRSTA
jgi:hypothetical protein